MLTWHHEIQPVKFEWKYVLHGVNVLSEYIYIYIFFFVILSTVSVHDVYVLQIIYCCEPYQATYIAV
jgi:hypothetical protein